MSSDELEWLLEKLSGWERDYGIRFSGDPNLVDTGEGNAAIDDLKQKLNERGARYHWDGPRREYVLDSVGPPPGGESEPTLE